MTPAGFPHSDIAGSKPVCGSPTLFAAYHVLHRLLVPRHPPCALSSLTIFTFRRHGLSVEGQGPSYKRRTQAFWVITTKTLRDSHLLGPPLERVDLMLAPTTSIRLSEKRDKS